MKTRKLAQFDMCFDKYARYALKGILILSVHLISLSASVSAGTIKNSSNYVQSDAASMSVSADGYQQTVAAFTHNEQRAGEISQQLRKLHDETSRLESDSHKQLILFRKKLAELYPGSTYNGTLGTAIVDNESSASFDNKFSIGSIKKIGAVKVSYEFSSSQIMVSNEAGSATILIDRKIPFNSKFINVTLPAIEYTADKILVSPGYKRIAADSSETSVFNDAYKLLSQTNGLRMDNFAADVLQNPANQSEILGIAETGYRERHPSEYVIGAESARPKKMNTVTAGKQVNILSLAVRGLIFCFLAFAVYWIARVVLRLINAPPSFNYKARQQIEKYNALSPVVLKNLKKLGRSLWGSNILWSKKYFIAKRSERWILSDSRCDKPGLSEQANTRIDVYMNSASFGLRISRLRGEATDITFSCVDFSQQELVNKLREIRDIVQNHNTSSL